MKRYLPVLVAGFVLAFVAGAAVGSSTINACINPNGLTFIVEDPADCGQNDTALSWSTGGGAATTFTERSSTFEWPDFGTVGTYYPYDVACLAGETAISGGWYFVDPLNEPGGERIGGTTSGRIVDNGWQVIARDLGSFPFSDITVFVVCAG